MSGSQYNDLVRILAEQQRYKRLANALAPEEPPPLPPSAIAAALLGTPQSLLTHGLRAPASLGSSPPTFGGLLSQSTSRRDQFENYFANWEKSESNAETHRIERAVTW